MITYRFTRTGNKPASARYNTTTLLACFEFCTDFDKARLQKFISDEKLKSITFQFSDYEVVRVFKED